MRKTTTFIIKQKENIAVLGLFLSLTLIAARSVLTQLDAVIIGKDNDVYINLWADWWTQKVLQDSSLTLWQTDFMFYPQGVNLIYHSFSHLNTLVSTILGSFLKPLPAYNLAILLNFVLAGFAMYQLAKYLTNSTSAGILAGIVFTYNSHNLYQSCHPVLVSIWCFPWLTLYLFRAIDEKSVKWALLAAFFVFLGAFSSSILLILIALWLTILFGFMLITKRWAITSWRIFLVFFITSTLLVIPLIFPLLREMAAHNSSFNITSGKLLQTDMASIFIPSRLDWFDRSLYFGVLPLIFILLASKGKEATLWFLLLVTSYLFAIGPHPTIFYNEVAITLPWSSWLAVLLRNTYRVNILMSFALAMLTALGWKVLATSLPKKKAHRMILAGIVAVGILVDYLPSSFPHTPIYVSSFYTEYAKQISDDTVFAVLPNGRQEGKRHLFFQTIHEHKITGGVVSRSNTTIFDFIKENAVLAAGDNYIGPVPIATITSKQLNTLAQNNIDYLIIDKLLDTNYETWKRALPIQPLFEDDLVLVYTTKSTPNPVLIK